jgi:hypothetical protein
VRRRVHREYPLVVNGTRVGARDLVDLVRERMRSEDYLDLFETVYAWFEETRRKLIE